MSSATNVDDLFVPPCEVEALFQSRWCPASVRYILPNNMRMVLISEKILISLKVTLLRNPQDTNDGGCEISNSYLPHGDYVENESAQTLEDSSSHLPLSPQATKYDNPSSTPQDTSDGDYVKNVSAQTREDSSSHLPLSPQATKYDNPSSTQDTSDGDYVENESAQTREDSSSHLFLPSRETEHDNHSSPGIAARTSDDPISSDQVPHVISLSHMGLSIDTPYQDFCSVVEQVKSFSENLLRLNAKKKLQLEEIDKLKKQKEKYETKIIENKKKIADVQNKIVNPTVRKIESEIFACILTEVRKLILMSGNNVYDLTELKIKESAIRIELEKTDLELQNDRVACLEEDNAKMNNEIVKIETDIEQRNLDIMLAEEEFKSIAVKLKLIG